MSKKIIIPKTNKQALRLQDKVDGFLLGLENFSVGFETTYRIEQINEYVEAYPHKEIFVSVNKNVANHEIEALKEKLHELNNVSIKGVLFYDLAVLRLYKKHSFSYDLIWAQEHFTTNYATMNYYQKEGVKGVYVSPDITKEEIIEIKKCAKPYLIVSVFGYIPLFTSKRNLVENYKRTFHLKDTSTHYFLEKNKEKYRIVDDYNGTNVYSSHIVNGIPLIETMESEKIEYLLFNSFGIEEDIFEKTVELSYQINQKNKEKICKQIEEINQEKLDTGFLYKKTIYRVKK